MKKTFKFETNTAGDNALEVHTFYQKPGYNYYSGDRESGGFYLSFQPGNYSTRPGSNFSTFSFKMFTTGFKIKVMDATRNNKKKCGKILDLITREVAEKAFEGDKDWVLQFTKQIKL